VSHSRRVPEDSTEVSEFQCSVFSGLRTIRTVIVPKSCSCTKCSRELGDTYCNSL
jgi:hypothetical protein